jgi:hypothetical protein
MNRHLMVVDFHTSDCLMNAKVVSYTNDFENRNMIFDISIEYPNDFHHKLDRQINKSLVIKIVDIHWINI